MEFRTLREEELESWFDHCMYVFNQGQYDDGFRKRFVNHYLQDPTASLNRIFVAVCDGEIVSTVRLFLREIQLKDKKIKVAGIGEVSTKEPYRNQGIAGELMGMALEEMENEGVVLSLLATGVPSFYEQKGWQSINLSRNLYRSNNSDILPYQMKEINFKRDVKYLESLYSIMNASGYGGVWREKAYWDQWVQSEEPEGYLFFNKEEAVGYIFIDEENDYILVKEVGGTFDFKLDDVLSFVCLVYGYEKVLIPSFLKSNLPILSFMNKTDWMLRLNQPLELCGTIYHTTAQLVNDINNESIPFYFWETDGF